MEFVIVGSAAGGEILAGNTQGLYNVQLNKYVNMSFKVHGYEWSEPVPLEDIHLDMLNEKLLRLVDDHGRVLGLKVRNEKPKNGAGARRVRV